MTVDRAKAVTKAVDGQTFYFCSNHCLRAFEADPTNYVHADGRPIGHSVAGHDGAHAEHEHPHTHT